METRGGLPITDQRQLGVVQGFQSAPLPLAMP